MRLINYGAGELADRLSILTLKILHGEAARRDVSHWITERAAVMTKLAGRTLGRSWIENYAELSAVNSAIWFDEDRLRSLRAEIDEGVDEGAIAFYSEAGKIGVELQTLNDRRARLIEQINRDSGEHQGSEKL